MKEILSKLISSTFYSCMIVLHIMNDNTMHGVGGGGDYRNRMMKFSNKAS